MDRKAPAASSSSQNVRIILSIEERGAGRDQLKLTLDDGSSFFVLREETFPFIPELGAALDSDKFEWLVLADDKYRCRKKALDLLAVKGEFTGALRQKLLKREFREQGIEENLEWLRFKGYLDDFDLSVRWIKSRLKRNPEGKSVIKAALLSRGVTRDIVETALEEIDENLWYDSLKAAVQKKITQGMDQEKILRYFCRKGFSYGEVKRFIDSNIIRE